jgi:hypothetical protein
MTTECQSLIDKESLGLHDFISLGEVELGLPPFSKFNLEGTASINEVETISLQVPVTNKEDEIYRLPFLLRILQLSRPLSAIPVFIDDEKPDNIDSEHGCDNKDRENDLKGQSSVHTTRIDPIICDAVNRIEDRAAAYSTAEGVEVVSCYLAPTVTRYISRVPTLVPIKKMDVQHDKFKHHEEYLEKRFDTAQLQISLEKTTSSGIRRNGNGSCHSVYKGKKRSRLSNIGNDDENEHDNAINASDSSGDEMKNDSKRGSGRQENEIDDNNKNTASKDSQEFAVFRTVQELVRLTIQSLNQSPSSTGLSSATMDDDADSPVTLGNSSNRALCISMQDSILSESARTKQQQTQSGICDLPATLASLMHYVPCLSCRHVAVSD